jgi:hypothetical protein
MYFECFVNIFSNYEYFLNKNLLKVNILFEYFEFDDVLIVDLMNILLLINKLNNDIIKIKLYTSFVDEHFLIVQIDLVLIEVFLSFH